MINTTRRFTVPVIRVFEPALCCNTGVCGPELDQQLVQFTADVNALKQQGVDIERANLASDPAVFAGNPAVVSFLQVSGSEGLPLTMVDGVTVMTGRHPRREELARFAGVAARPSLPVVSDCCSGDASTGCC
ncbi:arsenite efflux transporter metallochaperone ArsD [Propionibacteriaceae bacterium G1746]|uniref:arsenite efflux transporter metallochaperone ArsD n=1 Tax=Aestuariimicrobium sp. G57 TaxID=3418485 RepID=UPI003C192A94